MTAMTTMPGTNDAQAAARGAVMMLTLVLAVGCAEGGAPAGTLAEGDGGTGGSSEVEGAEDEDALGVSSEPLTRCEPFAGDIINNSGFPVRITGDNLPGGATMCMASGVSSHDWRDPSSGCIDVDFAWSANRQQWCKIGASSAEVGIGRWLGCRWMDPGVGGAPPRPRRGC